MADSRTSLEQRVQALEATQEHLIESAQRLLNLMDKVDGTLVALKSLTEVVKEQEKELNYLLSLQPKGKGALNPALHPDYLRKNGLL